jgi:flagellar biosynthesis protein
MSPVRQAIALEYGAHAVPMVTAKGDGAVADMIVEEARKQGVYVSQDPQLLALLSRLNVDDEIPTELYTTVAVILSWVYWLKGMRPGDEKWQPTAALRLLPKQRRPILRLKRGQGSGVLVTAPA